jgi:hypothetical protein
MLYPATPSRTQAQHSAAAATKARKVHTALSRLRRKGRICVGNYCFRAMAMVLVLF